MKTSSVNKFNFIKSVIIFSVVLVFGIVFLTLFLNLKKPVPENYIETNARITRIEEELSPTFDASDDITDADYDHTVFVEYSYNGKTYTDVEYGNYSSSMKEGDTVLLYIDPDDPAEYMSDTSGDFVFVIVGIVVILIGAGGLGYSIYSRKKKA